MKNLSELNIDSFLRFGYFLETDYDKHTNFLSDYKLDESLLSLNEEEVLELLEENFMNIIHDGYDSSKQNIVPLSGGLDSRAILGGLLEVTEAKNIQTLTYGSKGTLDYELGNKVAKEFGTSHVAIPLDNQKWELEDLIGISNKFSRQTILFTHPPLAVIEQYFESSVIWSGYMGDPVAGSFIVKEQGLQNAVEKIIKKNIITKLKMSKNADDDLAKLLNIPEEKIVNQLTWYEHINILNRQKKYIAPHVLMGDYTYKTPFTDEKWINLMFNLDNKYRENEYIYKKFLLKSFNDIFSIGVKNNGGLPLNASPNKVKYYNYKNKAKSVMNNYIPNLVSNPYTNYIDFSREIRSNSSLLKLIKALFFDLEKRKIVWWLDLNEILKDHLTRKTDNSMEIIILSSLEIHLKAMNH